MLLHGLTASADLNWFPAFETLGRSFRVVSYDHRGYGDFGDPGTLEDCADDAVALADALGIERLVAVGYSMGGAIAQLVWRRHPRRVQGLVLCATATAFRVTVRERTKAAGLRASAAVARLAPALGRRYVGATLLRRFEGSPLRPWVVAELRRHHPAAILDCAATLARFSSKDWIGGVDVPTAVVVTTRDLLVPPWRQRALAGAVPGASVHEVDGDHGAFLAPDRFVPVLVEACRAVTGHPERNDS
ncbi:MAG: alpha/beta hydrolase [Actinomycetota bacterium]|nr:alpha/beta hydrolase [Actinomycetota bacterium]